MTDTKVSRGRRPLYADDAILDAIEDGCTTTDTLLDRLGLKSKTTLLIRLRRMRDEGIVGIVERTRREGFTITSNRGAGDEE